MKVILIFCIFLKALAIVIKGIDVSAWDENIDWNSVAQSQHFAIIRAGTGNCNFDEFWDINYNGAKNAGVKVGAYWYSYAQSSLDAKNEAKCFLKALEGKQFEWPVYYDIEEESIFDSDIQNDIAKAFCDVMEANKYYCGIYSSASPLTYNFDSSVTERYTIWVAHYGVERPSYYGEYDIWQKGSGPVPGAGDDCDIDEGYLNFEPIVKKNGLNGY